MFFETPRETRRVVNIMTRTGIHDELFNADEVSVMVRFASDPADATPSWMEVNDAIESTHLVIVTHENPEDFNADLAQLVIEHGPKGICGTLNTQDMEVLDRPARSAMIGSLSEVAGTIRAIAREQEGS